MHIHVYEIRFQIDILVYSKKLNSAMSKKLEGYGPTPWLIQYF